MHLCAKQAIYKYFDHYQSRSEINLQDPFFVILLAVFMNYQTKDDIEFKVQQKKVPVLEQFLFVCTLK